MSKPVEYEIVATTMVCFNGGGRSDYEPSEIVLARVSGDTPKLDAILKSFKSGDGDQVFKRRVKTPRVLTEQGAVRKLARYGIALTCHYCGSQGRVKEAGPGVFLCSDPVCRDEWNEEKFELRRADLLCLFSGKRPLISGLEVIGFDDGTSFPDDVTVRATIDGSQVMVWVDLMGYEEAIVWCNGEWSEN